MRFLSDSATTWLHHVLNAANGIACMPSVVEVARPEYTTNPCPAIIVGVKAKFNLGFAQNASCVKFQGGGVMENVASVQVSNIQYPIRLRQGFRLRQGYGGQDGGQDGGWLLGTGCWVLAIGYWLFAYYFLPNRDAASSVAAK